MMKRFISIVLAFALCISVLGGMSIAGAEDAVERTYTFNTTVVDKTLDGVWDSTLKKGALQSSIVPLTGYGTHGYKYWTADAATYNAASVDRVLQMTTARFRMYGNYDSKALLENKDGVRVALAFEKPSATPSFYKIVVERYTKGTGYMVWVTPLIEDNRDITYYQSDAALNGTGYSFSNSLTTLSELIYNNGEDDHAISFYGGYDAMNGYGQNMELIGLTLSPVDVTGITVALDKTDGFVGDTTKMTVKATLSDGTTMGVVDDYVKYESSDENVATVAADGTVTAKGKGITTIKASVGGFSQEIKYAVGQKTYSFIKPTFAAADWDSTLTAKNIQSSIIPVKGYGNHGYKYWDADDKTYANQSINVRALQYYTGGLRVWSSGDTKNQEFENENGATLALAFQTPPSGFYEITHESLASDGSIADIRIGMTHISAEDEAASERATAESFIKDANLVKYGPSSNKGIFSYDKIIAVNGEDNLIYAIHLDPSSRLSLGSVTLTELSVSAISLKADATELEIGDKTKLTASANDQPIAHSFVTYENLNPTVVKVTEDGTVTALATGEATIKATANGLSDTVEITVAEPAPELPGEAADETVNVYVAAENGGSIVSGDITIGSVNEVAIGKSITVKAEDDEVLRFSHWRNAAGKFVSENKTYTFKANTNTSLVAVFDKPEGDDGDLASVLLYNENKTFIDQYYIEKGKPFSLISAVAWPQMTGHVFREWSIPDDTIINSLTRAVAFFDVKDEVYNAKFYDSNDTTPDYTGSGKYGEEVSYTATGENFSHWEMADGSVVSYDKTMTLRLWADIELKAVYADNVKPVPTIILDEEDGAYFIAYSVPAGYEKVAAGIVFANSGTPTVNNCFSRATAERTDATGQFTATPNKSESVARGYLMFKKDGEIRVIYAD